MKKIIRLSAISKVLAFLTLIPPLYQLMNGMPIFSSTDEQVILLYILLIIPVFFALLSVSLKAIAKAIDPDYKGSKSSILEPPVILPPN